MYDQHGQAAGGGQPSDERAGLMEGGGWEADQAQEGEATPNPILRLAAFINSLKDRGEAKKAEVQT